MTWQASSRNSTATKLRDNGASFDAPQFLAGYPDLLTVRDLHALTGLSEQTIRAEINSGNLPGCRIGRKLYVPKTHFIDYIENGGGLK